MEKRIFMPDIGDNLELKQPWLFTLHPEYRNEKLGRVMKFSLEGAYGGGHWKSDEDGSKLDTIPVQLGIGTVLVIDRVYIRKGADDYSSVTFRITEGEYKSRFWAKLKDVNNILCDYVSKKSTPSLKWFQENNYPLYPSYLKSKSLWINYREHPSLFMSKADKVLELKQEILKKTKQINFHADYNEKKVFDVIVTRYYVDSLQLESEYVNSQYKFKLIDSTSGDPIGEWGTLQTAQKHAIKRLNKMIEKGFIEA